MASNVPADNYIITRSSTEAERLELQHRCILSCQGYHIHPLIQTSLPASPRIAELATGTAIWLRELASAHADAECHGFDISDAMFPGPETLPANVVLHTTDIKQPLSSRWEGYFDVVHVRLIMAAMRVEDWGVVVRHAAALLKPGGWLQWYEDDRPIAVRHSFRPVAPNGSAAKISAGKSSWTPPRMEHLSHFNRTIMPDDRALAMNYGYMNLDTLMSDPSIGALEEVSCDAFVIDREDDGGALRKAWAVMGMSAVWSMIKAREDAGASIADVGRDEWSELAMREIEAGGHWVSKGAVFVGRKQA